MASAPNFLTLPLEIRYQIYSYLLTHKSVVNILSADMVRPLRNGVVRACRQTFSEMIEYYYANNTFLLSLVTSAETTPGFLQRLHGVQHLQLKVGDLVFSPTNRAFSLPVHTQHRCDWLFKTLNQAKHGQEGRFLKTLVAVDHCGTSIVSE